MKVTDTGKELSRAFPGGTRVPQYPGYISPVYNIEQWNAFLGYQIPYPSCVGSIKQPYAGFNNPQYTILYYFNNRA